jgi:hypothetical protein
VDGIPVRNSISAGASAGDGVFVDGASMSPAVPSSICWSKREP